MELISEQQLEAIAVFLACTTKHVEEMTLRDVVYVLCLMEKKQNIQHKYGFILPDGSAAPLNQ